MERKNLNGLLSWFENLIAKKRLTAATVRMAPYRKQLEKNKGRGKWEGRKGQTLRICTPTHQAGGGCQHFSSGVLLPCCKAARTWLQGLTKMSAKNQNFFDKNPGKASSQGGEGGLTAGTALEFPVSGFPGSTNFSQWLDPINENLSVHLYSLKVTLVTLPLPPTLLSTQPCHSTSRNMYFYGWVWIFWKRVDDGKLTASRSWEPFGSIPLPSYCCDPKPLHHWPVGTGKATEAPVGLWKGP